MTPREHATKLIQEWADMPWGKAGKLSSQPTAALAQAYLSLVGEIDRLRADAEKWREQQANMEAAMEAWRRGESRTIQECIAEAKAARDASFDEVLDIITAAFTPSAEGRGE